MAAATPDLKEKEATTVSAGREAIIGAIGSSIFELHYRNSFRPTMTHIVAESIEDAKKKGLAYCAAWNLKFISVTHFFCDVTRQPPFQRSYGDET